MEMMRLVPGVKKILGRPSTERQMSGQVELGDEWEKVDVAEVGA